MKLSNVLSVLSVTALLAACGANQNQAFSPSGFGANGNGFQTGFGTAYQANSVQTPLYQSNGQIIGYKSRNPVLGGLYPNVTSETFTQSVQVNAGDRLFVNLTQAKYGVTSAYCRGSLGEQLISSNKTYPLTNIALLLNGQPMSLNNGSDLIASASGTLTIQATLNPVTVSCGFLFKNRAAEIRGYFVNLGGGASSGYYGSSAAVEIERCTNIQGAAMSCPY